jgi:hypothetical protein
MKKRIKQNRDHAHKIFFAPSCATEGNETVQFHSQPYANVGQVGPTKAFTGYAARLVDVPCGPLSPVLESILDGHINFFSLDVEGAEAMVLKTIDFSKVTIDVLIAESINAHCKQQCEGRSEARQIMKDAGYKLYINWVYRSDLFVHPSVNVTLPPGIKEGYSDRMQQNYFRFPDPSK